MAGSGAIDAATLDELHIGGEGEPPAPPREPSAPETTKEPEPRPV